MSALALNDYNELERFLRLFTADVGVIQYVATLRMDILHVRLSKLLTGLQHLSRFSIVPRTLVGVVRGVFQSALSISAKLASNNIVRLYVQRRTIGTDIRALHERISLVAMRLGLHHFPYTDNDDSRLAGIDRRRLQTQIQNHVENPHLIDLAVRRIRNVEEARNTRLGVYVELHERRDPPLDRTTQLFLLEAQRVLDRILVNASPSRAPLPLSGGIPLRPVPQRSRSRSLPPATKRPALINPLLPPNKPVQHVRWIDEVQVPSTAPMRRPIDSGSMPSPALINALRHERHASDTDFARDPLLFTDVSPSSSGLSPPTPTLRTSSTVFTVSPEYGAIPAFSSSLPTDNKPLFPQYDQAGRNTVNTMPSRPHAPLRVGTGINTMIQYWDTQVRHSITWKPFEYWLWPIPPSKARVMDSHDLPIEPLSIVRIVTRFSAYDDILALALVNGVIEPSVSPRILSAADAAIDHRLQVIQIFDIRGTIWLACVAKVAAVAGSKRQPGLIPLAAVVADRVGAQTLSSTPPKVDAPLHSSTRTYTAIFTTIGQSGTHKRGRVTCLIRPRRLSYCEIPKEGISGNPSWKHFPYNRMVSLRHAEPTTHIIMVFRETATFDRTVDIALSDPIVARHFYEDMLTMHSLQINASLS